MSDIAAEKAKEIKEDDKNSNNLLNPHNNLSRYSS